MLAVAALGLALLGAQLPRQAAVPTCAIPTRVLPSPEEFLSSLDHYEIAFPIQVDQNGDFLTFDMRRQLKPRPRRSLPYEPSEQQVFYKVSAHHTQFLLNLTLHSNLLAEHFTVEYWKRDGMDWQHDFHEDCHYAGHLQDQYLSSKVAISNCNGLVSPALASQGPCQQLWSSSRWIRVVGKAWDRWRAGIFRTGVTTARRARTSPVASVGVPDPWVTAGAVSGPFPRDLDWNGIILALWVSVGKML